MTRYRRYLHALATALILLGFGMLCQPFTVALYSLGLPVLLAGVALFIVADHLPAGPPTSDQG